MSKQTITAVRVGVHPHALLLLPVVLPESNVPIYQNSEPLHVGPVRSLAASITLTHPIFGGFD